jgi:hypothetical protein
VYGAATIVPNAKNNPQVRFPTPFLTPFTILLGLDCRKSDKLDGLNSGCVVDMVNYASNNLVEYFMLVACYTLVKVLPSSGSYYYLLSGIFCFVSGKTKREHGNLIHVKRSIAETTVFVGTVQYYTELRNT